MALVFSDFIKCEGTMLSKYPFYSPVDTLVLTFTPPIIVQSS